MSDGLLPSIDYQPCVYAEYDPELTVWKIGLRSYVKAEEQQINVPNRPEYRTLDFALRLLELYKKGGKKAVEKFGAKII